MTCVSSGPISDLEHCRPARNCLCATHEKRRAMIRLSGSVKLRLEELQHPAADLEADREPAVGLHPVFFPVRQARCFRPMGEPKPQSFQRSAFADPESRILPGFRLPGFRPGLSNLLQPAVDSRRANHPSAQLVESVLAVASHPRTVVGRLWMSFSKNLSESPDFSVLADAAPLIRPVESANRLVNLTWRSPGVSSRSTATCPSIHTAPPSGHNPSAWSETVPPTPPNASFRNSLNGL